jgi:Bacterial type II and III secretion system protein/Bacterial type II/III secretion system short domain
MMKKLVLILLFVCTNVFAETEFKIFSLQHRFANDLLPIVEPMVGPDGTANAIDSQLIIRASPQRMQEIAALVAQMDAARVNRKITVNTSNNMQTQRESVEASGSTKVGKVTVSNDRRTQNSNRPNSGRVEIENNNSNTRQTSNQFINVLDGERAFIRVGQLVPFTQEWVTITRRYIQVDRFTDWREVATGFAVRPRTIANAENKQVELEITPRIAKLNNQGYIDFEELTTVIRTSLGSWVDIGGTMQQNDEVSRKILGRQSVSSQQNSNLSVKVD